MQDNSSPSHKTISVDCLIYDKTAHTQQVILFEGKLPLYGFMEDPLYGDILACIPASDDDVACCQISNNGIYPPIAVPNPATWGIMPAATGPDRVPDWLRYVITTEDIIATKSPPHDELTRIWVKDQHMEVLS